MMALLKGITILTLVIIIMIGGFYITKHGSWYFWYNDMVEDKIKEMVKPEALK